MRPAPFNTFVHATEPAGPRDTFVSVNNDTLYSMAYLDMSGGPLRLTVPDAAGAYYGLQFVDAWTNNVAYVGTRATGTEAAEFLLVPPGWTGTAPDGASVIPIPTTIAVIVGRTAFHGRDNLPRVRALELHCTSGRRESSVRPAWPAFSPREVTSQRQRPRSPSMR